NPVLGTYIYDLDKHGIGKNSVKVVKYNDEWVPFEIGKFDNSGVLNFKDLNGEDYREKAFFFKVARLRPLKIDFNKDNLAANYFSLKGKYSELATPQQIRKEYTMGRSGEGKLVLRLDKDKLINKGKVIKEIPLITFILYDPEALSMMEASCLHLDYNKESYTYRYNPKKGFNSSNYAQASWWARDIAKLWHKIDYWKDSKYIASLYNRRFKADKLVYDGFDKRESSLRERYFRVDGRDYAEYYEGIGIDNPKQKMVYLDEVCLPSYSTQGIKPGWPARLYSRIFKNENKEELYSKFQIYFQYDGAILWQLNEERVVSANILQQGTSRMYEIAGENPNRQELSAGGTTNFIKSIWYERKIVPYATMLSLGEKELNSLFGKLIDMWKKDVPEKKIDKAISESEEYKKIEYLGQGICVGAFAIWLAKAAGIFLGIIIFFGLLNKLWKAKFRRKLDKKNFNEASLEDLLDWGFLKMEAVEILRIRRHKGPFKTYDKLKSYSDKGLEKTISGKKKAEKKAHENRQDEAKKRLEKSFKVRYDIQGITAIYQGEIRTIEKLLNIYGLANNLGVNNSQIGDSQVNGSRAPPTLKDVLEVSGLSVNETKEVLDKLIPYREQMSEEAFRERFLADVMRKSHFNGDTLMKNDIEKKIRERVHELFSNLGLGISPSEENFLGEYAYLYDTIIKSIKQAADFEGLNLPREKSPSAWYVVTNDDLEKEANRDLRIRARLVSLEQFVLMQVISLKVVSMNGNGRFEDWLYKKITSEERTSSWHRNPEQGKLAIRLILKIYAPLSQFRGILFRQMGGGTLPGKGEQVKDRFGIHRYHQWSLLWEELNDAFRYLLGQDDWERDGKLDIKDKRTKEAFEKLRGKLDGYLTRIYNGEEEINEEEFLRLMRAIIMSVESIQKRPRTKHRLKHYQLFWMPFWKFVISRTLRRKVLAKDNPFKEHLTDWNRKFNVSVVFIFTFVFMSYLFVKAFINLGLVGIPYFLAFHPVVFLIPFILVCVQAIFLLLRGQAIKKANPEGVVRKHIIQLVIQAIALAVGFVLVLMLPPTIIVMVPEVVRIVLKLILCAIVFETLRLTFYSVHYARKAIISRRFYKENNIYSVVKYDELPEALDRLFSDEGNGWYYDTSKKITMGQERIEIFRQAILRELSSVEDYQLLIGERDFNKWEKLLEIYENKGRDINKLKELLNRGDETTVKERIHRIIHWANDQVRMDKPSPPRTLRDLLAYNLSEQGFEEDAYFNEKNLNEDGLNNSDNPDPENQKTQTTRLSMLARDKPAYWKALIARLSEGVVVDGERVCLTSDEEEKMKDLAKNPLQKLEINPLLMSYIIPWANTHLGNLWNTGVSSLKVKRRFEYTVKAIMPNYSEEQVKLHVEDKTDRNMIKHSGSLCPIEEAFEKLSDEERGGPQIKTFREYLYYYVPGRRQQYLRGEISEKELLAEANQMAGLIESKYDINDKKKAPYYSAIKPLIVAMFMKGLTATWNRVPQGEQVHLFKWNSLTASLPYVHSLTLDLIDADHHSRTEDIWSLPEVASEYLYNPRVGAAIPIVDHYLAKGLGVVGKIIPPGENAFYYHAQTGKELMGGLTAYGKFSGRTKAWRWSEGLSGDDYVAEDSLTVVRFRSFGYICIRTSYYRRGKNWMYQSLNHKPPCFKWASDSGESVRGRIPLKLLLSDMVESTYIIDNFWWDGFGFFIKKPHLPRYLKWVVTCFLIFSWNLFAGISFLFWIMGTLFSQTVSYGSWFNSAYEDHHGLLKGFFLTFKDIFLRNFWYYVHWIFNYEEAAGIFGPEGLVRFISTGGKGAWIIRETRWQYIYLRDEHAIRTGVFWTVILLAFAPSSPWLMLIWFFPVFSFVAAWMGIYLLNPRLKKMDHLDNIKQIFFSGFWGFLDALNHLNAKVSLLFFWEKRVSHRQIGLLDAAVSQVFGAVDKRPDKGDLGPLYMLGVYNQYVSHYRRLFGTVSIVAMNEALRKVKEKGDLKEIQYALCQENRNFHPTA
ncbi:MAG: hypothetical protein KJ569_06520, partial [Candidatus Omnitrophica bacterium]|nr:hypothetical protein [Candidatus Omnitrophota bacterium]